MVSESLTPSSIASYIERVEMPLRSVGRWKPVAAEIFRYGGFVGSVVEHHLSLDRTMLAARELISRHERAERSVSSGTTIIADMLTASKGRFTRSWHAPEGGLWGTLILVNTLLPAARQLLPLAAGIACCEAVRRCGVDGATIRWINDVLINGRKVGGFLCESFNGEWSGEEYCLIGFGINVNNRMFPPELQDNATSVSLSRMAPVDLLVFQCMFFAALSWNIGLLCYCEALTLRQEEQEDTLHPLLQQWLALSDSIGRRVVYGFDVVTKPLYRAVVTGLADDGGLRLLLEDGVELIEHSGEIRYLEHPF